MAETQGSGAIEQLRTAVAIAGVLVTVTYVTGAVMVAAQLALAGLPSISVIGTLPRESTIAGGAGLVIGPAIVAGVLYAFWRFSFRSGAAPPSSHRRWNSLQHPSAAVARQRWKRERAVGVVVLATPAIVHAWHLYGLSSRTAGLAILILAASIFATVGYLHGRARVAEKWGARRGHKAWSRPVPVAIGSAVFAGAVTIAFLAYWAIDDLAAATVCMRPSDTARAAPFVGVFVGQTNDRVYLGDGAGPRRSLRSFPTDVVDRVVLDQATPGECPETKATTKVNDVSPPADSLTAKAITEYLAIADAHWRARHALHLRAWRAHHRRGGP